MRIMLPMLVASLLLSAAAVSFLVLRRTTRGEDPRIAALEAALAERDARLLRRDLQPHMLFNLLHSLAGAIRTDPETAEQMATRLGDLLRATLLISDRLVIPLREEIAITGTYLDVQRLRLESPLEVVWRVDESLMDVAVPPLLLQPLVENSIRHGLAGTGRAGLISISAMAIGARLHLTIRDNGRGHDDNGARAGFGIGLHHTTARIATLYGREGSVRLQSSPAEGTTVVIMIPLG
jgi:two-component system, LytTR family, sensor kinase